MKHILVIIFFLVSICYLPAAFAENEGYTVKPKFWDSKPGDGIMDTGSSLNPMVVKDKNGKELYQIRPRYWTPDPSKAGGSLNPYEIKPVR